MRDLRKVISPVSTVLTISRTQEQGRLFCTFLSKDEKLRLFRVLRKYTFRDPTAVNKVMHVSYPRVAGLDVTVLHILRLTHVDDIPE